MHVRKRGDRVSTAVCATKRDEPGRKRFPCGEVVVGSRRRTERVSLSVCLSAEDTDASGCAPRSLSCYLVDPASSHMLVSKIKPCMSKFTLSSGETANGSLNQSRFLRWSKVTWITVVILELIHAEQWLRTRTRQGAIRKVCRAIWIVLQVNFILLMTSRYNGNSAQYAESDIALACGSQKFIATLLFDLRCRLLLSLRSWIRKAFDCSPTNRERVMGLDRQETG